MLYSPRNAITQHAGTHLLKKNLSNSKSEFDIYGYGKTNTLTNNKNVKLIIQHSSNYCSTGSKSALKGLSFPECNNLIYMYTMSYKHNKIARLNIAILKCVAPDEYCNRLTPCLYQEMR